MEGIPIAAESKVTLHSDGSLSWPLILVYPEHSQSDLIASFHEDSLFQDHLEEVLSSPASWDSNFDYQSNHVDLYFETKDSPPRLIQFGRKVSLKQILQQSSFVVRGGIPAIVVLSQKTPFQKIWLDKYKSQREEREK